jgi:CBS-domain-containing membrane protein
MLSDRDVQACIGDPSQVFAGGCDRYDSSLEVRHAMKRPVAVATPEQRCTSAARTLADSYASVVPVVDDAQVLVGIVTYVDLLRAFAD